LTYLLLHICAPASVTFGQLALQYLPTRSASIYNYLQDDGIPVSEKWRAVEQLMLCERAVEEIERVKNDILATVRQLLSTNSALSATASDACSLKRSLILRRQNDLHNQMRAVWQVAFKYLNEVPPLPTMPTCECVDENIELLSDGCASATLDDGSSDSDDSDD
jgi:hypothetical protein